MLDFSLSKYAMGTYDLTVSERMQQPTYPFQYLTDSLMNVYTSVLELPKVTIVSTMVLVL